ncbi:unnamed protein product [Linum trigynum]|uniref:Uncharacterized protein n=1 Tax=Linum trigynum TaxID=586398 RepID=A0AAV2G4A4_9ROSI
MLSITLEGDHSVHLVVRYLHVPSRCTQCNEYGHCDGEGKECKVVHAQTGRELVVAEAMTDDVAWVAKQVTASSSMQGGGGPLPVARSNTNGRGPIQVVGSNLKEGDSALVVELNGGGPVSVAGSILTEGGPVQVAGSILKSEDSVASSSQVLTPNNGKIVDGEGF